MNAIIPGSIGAVAEKSGQTLAESFLSADVIVLVDVSGSMASDDAKGGRTRYAVACDELAKLQNSLPGKICVLAFSGETRFCPTGVPFFLRGSTDLTAALEFVKPADGTVDLIVISDGSPDNEITALKVAQSLESKIDTVYVGPENDMAGPNFLRRLSKVAKGAFVTSDRASDLASKVQALMLGTGANVGSRNGSGRPIAL